MKNLALFVMLLSLGAFVLGCAGEADKPAAPVEPPATTDIDEPAEGGETAEEGEAAPEEPAPEGGSAEKEPDPAAPPEPATE